MKTKVKVDANIEGAAAHHSAAAAKDSLNAAAHDAAAAALDAAASLKNTVKDYFPAGKSTKETHEETHKEKHRKEKIEKEKQQNKKTQQEKNHKQEKEKNQKKEKHQEKHQEKEHHSMMGGIAEKFIGAGIAKKLGEKLGIIEKKKEKMGIGEKITDKLEGMTGKFVADKFGEKFGEKFGDITDKFGMSEKLGMGGHHHDKSHGLAFFAMPSMAIIIALTVVLLSALFFMRRRRMGFVMQPIRRAMSWIQQKRIPKSTVLICGPADAGKTLLFHTLSGGKYQPTQTSMEENVNTFKIHEKVLGDAKKDKLSTINFEFIDFPGHPSRELQIRKFMGHLQGVVILVDASSSDSINQGAKTFFTLMERREFLNRKFPVLICANKIDLTDSQPLTVIRQRMLDELNKLKESRSTMENTEKRDEDIMSVGKSGERLSWDNLGMPVSFGQISAKQGNVTDVLDFLEAIQHH